MAKRDCPGCRAQGKHVAFLEARIRELEQRLGPNSTNSSIPPSANPPQAPPPVVKESTGRKPGDNRATDELYHANGASNGYLGQMTTFLRGTLSDTNSDGVPDTVASNSRSQSWSFDAVGNWSSVTTNGTGQTRTANQQNQITSITGLTTPVYDADGPMTTDQAGRSRSVPAGGRRETCRRVVSRSSGL
jgi:hypothetical protein